MWKISVLQTTILLEKRQKFADSILKIGDDALADTVKEIEIMKACDSPWVVAYYDNFARGDEIWIIMEYLSQVC